MTPLNILYLHSHDTGRYIQPYGHAIPTPNLQEFAEQGVVFRNTFCASPSCSASRASLLSGQCAHSSGMIGLAHRGFSMKEYSHHLARFLQANGYETVLAGIQHVIMGNVPDWQKVLGYSQHLTEPKETVKKVQAFLSSGPKEPFFLDVGFTETHREYPESHPEDPPGFCQPPLPLPDVPEVREDMARFNASARILDEKMGAVLEALKVSGLEDRTLVVLTTDHGIAFPRMKSNLTDGGTGVMLMMRGPVGFSGGKIVDGLASHVDVFPTLCEAIGLEKPEWLQGVSLLPLVSGESSEVREQVFSEITYHAAYEPMRSARTPRWKYIKRFDGRTKPVLPNCDDGLSKSLWISQGWPEHSEESLYDLTVDPTEMNNLASSADHASTLSDMRQRLDTWMKETEDPLLKGPVPAPPGARVNDPDGVSPKEEPFSGEEWNKRISPSL